MGKKTGAFEVVQSEDMAVFTDKNLKQFDAICFNNTTRLAFEDASHRKALLDFVKGGKGIIGIHAATDNFYNWPEATKMMGGTFDGHPWTSGGTWAFKVDEPGHTLTKSLDSEGFKLSDEIYRQKPLRLRDRCRVLVSLDMNDDATRNANSKKGGILPTDNDIAISWVHPYGKGRVFFTGFGHNHNIFWNEAILAHILAGAQYATVIDIDKNNLPSAEDVEKWNGQAFADALRHDQSCSGYNSDIRQLLHVGYKIAAQMGDRYLDSLQKYEEQVVAVNVTQNIYDRHILPVFIG